MSFGHRQTATMNGLPNTSDMSVNSSLAAAKEQIKCFARNEYPTDYNMQKFIVEQQLDALQWIIAFREPRIPATDLQQILKFAQSEYPQDFSMQKFIVEQQVQGYLFMLET